jgi:hypothetical protein
MARNLASVPPAFDPPDPQLSRDFEPEMFEGKEVVSVAMIFRDLGDALGDAVKVAPIRIEDGDEGYSLIKWRCGAPGRQGVRFDETKPEKGDESDDVTLTRVQVVYALGVANIPDEIAGDTVNKMIAQVEAMKADEKERKRAEKTGEHTFPFGGAPLDSPDPETDSE